MRAILAGLTTAVLTVGLGGFAAAQDDKIDAKLLVGKWTPEDADKKGKLFVEMTKDGKMQYLFTFEKGDMKKEFKIEGTYKLDGNKLTVKVELFGKEKTETMVVNSLTKKALVTTDEKGKKETLVRVTGVKKD